MKSLLAFSLVVLYCFQCLNAVPLKEVANTENVLARSKRSLFYRNDDEGIKRDDRHRKMLSRNPVFGPSPLANQFQIHTRNGQQAGGNGLNDYGNQNGYPPNTFIYNERTKQQKRFY
jgi:hypothetical protein